MQIITSQSIISQQSTPRWVLKNRLIQTDRKFTLETNRKIPDGDLANAREEHKSQVPLLKFPCRKSVGDT